MRTSLLPRWAPGVAAVVVLLTAGCGSSTATASGSGVEVVAATNVWGNIASSIGGDRVHVTSVITDPSADPHSYEASARTRLAVSRAAVVIENGGGYDDFMGRLITATGSKAPVVDAVDASGAAAAAKSAGTELNEHVWYDFAAVGKVADAITATLAKADPAGAAAFRSNAARFQGQLNGLIARETADRASTQGAGVAITEPVPLDLLDALGAVNKTPPAFSHAVEEGTDVSPEVLQQTLDLFTGHEVKALVYNAQTTDAQTEQLQRAAQAAQVAVVPVTETLPPGKDYLQWMTDNLAAIKTALSA